MENLNPGLVGGNSADTEEFRHSVEEIFTKVDKLEERVNEVEKFYSTTGGSSLKDKDREKHVGSVKKMHQDAAKREAAAAKRMQELMRQFATILRQLTQHKWAWPFLEPVDVEGLGLHDYYEVIEKPMDFGTIKNKMEGKDGSGYKNVRDIYADVRLVFKNAMKYNDEKDDVHVMAKTLLDKFEEKWLQLLPKVAEEEKSRADEEAEAQIEMQLAQEFAYAKMARDISNELHEVDAYLRRCREVVVQRCRRMSSEEKKVLGDAIVRLAHEDITRALEIVAENNPSIQTSSQEVDLNFDALSEYTLWRLKVFVKAALKNQGNSNDENKKNNSKRRREICDALAKTAVKRKKLTNS
ncbi:hypothetical protein UlMin_009181 [Ulmus minor]